MATGTPTGTRTLSSQALLPLRLLNNLAFSPIFTGPLLLILLRGPPDLRERLLQPFRNNLLTKVQLPTVIKTLKWLFGLGLASRINRLLSTFVLNHGKLSHQGKGWNFDKGGKDEVILITGGSMGFGLNMVKMFSERAPQAKLIVLDVQDLPPELKSVPNLTFYKCDLTSQSDVDSTCEEVLNSTLPTVLINNAGIASPQTILDTKQEWLQKEFTINVFCHYQLIQKFLPKMLKSRKGHIVTIASIASYVVVPGLVDYCASKAAVLALHEGLTMELTHRYPNGHTINTTSVHPTFARTNLTAGWDKYLAKQQVLTPETVADAVVKHVMRGKSGQVYLPGWLTAATGIRGWPVWVSGAVRGNLEREVRLGT